MIIAYLTEGEPLLGSAYKYPKLMGKNHQLQAELEGADLALVRGYSHKAWKLAQNAGIPWVVLQHDTLSVEKSKCSNRERSDERAMLEESCGVLFVSEQQRGVCGKYKIPNGIVVPLKPLEEDLPPWPTVKQKGKHIVYAGSIGKAKARRYRYRCLHGVMEELLEEGWQVHIYHRPNQRETSLEYTELGCSVHGFLPYPELLAEIGRYSCGLHALPNPDAHTATTIPNKTFDYLAAGIPTFCIGDFPGARLAVEGGWATFDLNTLPTVTDTLRRQHTMDTHEQEVQDWLEEAVRVAERKRLGGKLKKRRTGQDHWVFRG